MYGNPYMENGSFFSFPRVFVTRDTSPKEVSVNDMRLRILKLTEFTPENASHFPKMGGEGNEQLYVLGGRQESIAG